MTRNLSNLTSLRRSLGALALLSVFPLGIAAQAIRSPRTPAGQLSAYRRPSVAAAISKSDTAASAVSGTGEIHLAGSIDSSHIEGNIRVSDETGYPAAVYAANFKVSAKTPEAQARQYLYSSRDLFGFSVGDLDNLRLHHVRVDAAGTVVRLRQSVGGLPVNKNAEITIHIGRGGVVDFVQNGFVYGIELKDLRPAISAESARNQTTGYLGVAGTETTYEKTELMVLRHGNEDYLVYRVVVTLNEPAGEWESYIDAKTGAMLKFEDVAAYHRDRKTENQSGALMVSGTGNVFDPDPLTTAGAAYGGSYVDGSDANAAVLTAQLKSVTLPDITLSAGTYSLVGPYASIVDFEAPNKGLFTQASPTFAFDRSADSFEAVNTYYHIDSVMRYLNTTLGLSIMPYQYSGGVRFDPSGLSGADNSHYLSGSGQLAFGEGGVDDAEDADVVVHELGHGLHDWVTAGGLSQVNGLSEGTGDYIAGSYSRFRGGWTPAQPAFNWTFNWDGHNPFWGGRILNYAATYPGGLVNQIHTDGQIWATSNMKIWDDIGRQKADKAFFSGLAMTNASTNQTDAANAVLTAAINLGYTTAERNAMRARYAAAGYVLAPTAANVTIAGRVTTASGAGIRGVAVSLSDSEGNVRTVSSNSFGNYSFDVPAGATYVVSVASRKFGFGNASQVVMANDNVADLDFVADPR